MKRNHLALAAASALMGAASTTHEIHAGPLSKRMSDRDNIGVKNGLNCVSNGMAYTGGGSGISINRGDHTGQGKKSIAALKTAKDLGHAAVPTSLLAAAAKNSTACRAGARC